MGCASRLKLLLDTHVWLWARLNPERISVSTQRLIDENPDDLWLSPVTLWETLTLCRKNRLTLLPDSGAWIEGALRAATVREAPLTNSVVLALERIELPHADPADLFLAATAAAYDLALVTSDRNLLAGRGFRSIGNL